MTTDRTQLIQQSLTRLIQNDPQHTFIDRFYSSFTGHNPQIGNLFNNTDWQHQREKFMLALTMIIESERPETYLQKLGKDHLRLYGVTPDMADDFKAALLTTLAASPGIRWTDELQVAWSDATDEILGVMFEV
ncbi:MAG: globin domain-containing protein [Chloroflexota bacterium]